MQRKLQSAMFLMLMTLTLKAAMSQRIHLKKILDVDPALWRTDVEGIEEFYAKFGKTLPAELRAELDGLKGRLQ